MGWSLRDRCVLVTGGYGFIGAALIRSLDDDEIRIVNVDSNNYAGDPARLGRSRTRVRSFEVSVTDPGLRDVFVEAQPDVVVHLAAETHVTRGEGNTDRFFETNVDGTLAVMEAALACDVGLVVHLSTDEVYGPARHRSFTEEDKRPGEGNATSAYARSKALADDIAVQYGDRLPVVVARLTNCFGSWQHPEKAVARWTTRALSGQRLPVWGDGMHQRDWLYVEDACSALLRLMQREPHSAVYNVGSARHAITNIEMARAIARAAGVSEDAVYLTAYDRPDHDRAYSIDASRVRAIGWEAEIGIARGIELTVDWYRRNTSWWTDKVSVAEALYEDEAART